MNRAFAFGEATLQVTAAGLMLQSLSYVTALDIERTPTLLEDSSRAFTRIRLIAESAWVDDDITAIAKHGGPFTVEVRWQNEDDGRLRSDVLQDAQLTALSNRGRLGDVHSFGLTFEALSRI